MKHKYHPMKWFIWLFASFFYFYEYALRVTPSVIVKELMAAFSVTATTVGVLSGFYFFIFAPMQLPVGVLTDRYGARRLLAMASAIAGFGAVFFAIAEVFWMGCLGRFFMGLGSSFGFVGLIYVCSHWFEEKKRGIMVGLGSSIGVLGAVAGEGPLRAGVDAIGWRGMNWILAIVGFALAILIFLVVRNDPKDLIYHEKKGKQPNVLGNLKIVCKCKWTWLIGIISFFTYITTPGFAALWGIPFIHQVYGVSTELAGYAVSMVFIGWAIGGPVIGIIADKIHRKKPPMVVSFVLATIAMAIIVYVPNLPLPVLFTLFVLVGFFSGAQLLTYTYAIDVNPEHTKGTAIAFVNSWVVFGSALSQPLVGFILDRFWTGSMEDGIRAYSNEAFIYGMSIFPIFFLLGSLLTFFLRCSSETHFEKIPPIRG